MFVHMGEGIVCTVMFHNCDRLPCFLIILIYVKCDDDGCVRRATQQQLDPCVVSSSMEAHSEYILCSLWHI